MNKIIGDIIMFIDCSRKVTNNMPSFRLKNEDGTYTTFQAEIVPFLTREQTKSKYTNNVSFEMTKISFQSVIGTYLDSPYHRYADMDDISNLDLENLVGEGILISAQGMDPWEPLQLTESIKKLEITDKIVLINFGWDKYFLNDQYNSYPFISNEFIDHLVTQKPKIIGVDTVNIDNSNDLTRPAHSKLLREKILIIENLMNLHLLKDKIFRFYCVPAKFEGAASFPVRAFAELVD